MSVIFIISVSSWVLQPQIHFFAEYQDMYNDDGVGAGGWGGISEASEERERSRNGNVSSRCYNHHSFPSVTVLIQRCPGCWWQPFFMTQWWHAALSSLHSPMSTTPDCHTYWFFSHPVETSQLPPQSVGWRRNLIPRQDKCMLTALLLEHLHAALSLFHLLLLGLRKWKQRPQRTLDRSEA